MRFKYNFVKKTITLESLPKKILKQTHNIGERIQTTESKLSIKTVCSFLSMQRPRRDIDHQVKTTKRKKRVYTEGGDD